MYNARETGELSSLFSFFSVSAEGLKALIDVLNFHEMRPVRSRVRRGKFVQSALQSSVCGESDGGPNFFLRLFCGDVNPCEELPNDFKNL